MQQRGLRRAIDIAIPAANVPIARRDERLTDLLKRLGPASDGRAMVYDSDRLVGIVSPSDIYRRLHRGPAAPPAPAPA
jgi:predicted transcriptional regulator